MAVGMAAAGVAAAGMAVGAGPAGGLGVGDAQTLRRANQRDGGPGFLLAGMRPGLRLSTLN